jgi:2-dehydro-3-deoxy-D-gluconate 5-dehydrogenase
MSLIQLFDLTGKTAIVTGANKGIGYAIALGLAEAGADIIGASASIALEGSEIEIAVKKLGRTFKAFQVNLEYRENLYDFINKVKNSGVKIDILVNNAGTIMRSPAAEHSDDFWDKVISINLDSQFILAREFGAEMIKNGSGKIIFTASLLSFQGGINVPGYAASKGAISSLVKALSNEWAGKGVNVNAVAPGYVATDNTAALRADPVRNKSILDRIPAGRWAIPDDFIGPYLFLASAASDYVSGTILTVDGGWMGR